MNYFSIFVAFILATIPQIGLAGDSAAKPNIILVFIDDMGWADFSCFGNTDAETPAIDRMAKEGIAFE